MKIEKIVGLKDRAFLPNFVLEQHPGITRDLMECCTPIIRKSSHSIFIPPASSGEFKFK
jgi:hypothetical protein